ncbi:hypothetical protein HD806DRAFT_511608 [Xylariaceae sp. AK1471]|nr:hypothetical protein HD806DRAFT_511608 [Xylariaceae sp. AK1471]
MIVCNKQQLCARLILSTLLLRVHPTSSCQQFVFCFTQYDHIRQLTSQPYTLPSTDIDGFYFLQPIPGSWVKG